MSDEEKKPFNLEADPYQTGFEFAGDSVTTDVVIQFVKDRRSFIPKDEPMSDMEWWKANCKAAIKNKWFSVPDWVVGDVGKWPPGMTKWLSDWINAKYEAMLDVPFD